MLKTQLKVKIIKISVLTNIVTHEDEADNINII